MTVYYRILTLQGEEEKKFSEYYNVKPIKMNYTTAEYLIEQSEYIEKKMEDCEKDLGFTFFKTLNTKYSKTDYEEAEWYDMWSGYHAGYNLCDEDSKIPTFDSNVCPYCFYDRKQVSLFGSRKFKETPNRYFVSLFVDVDFFFVFAKGKEKLDELNLPELKYLRIYDGGYHYLENIYQMDYPIESVNSFIPDESVKKTNICPVCGHVDYVQSGRQMSFKKEIFNKEGYDIFKTYQTFGDGACHYRDTIISKRLYLFLKENKMLSGVYIDPIKLI